MDPVTLGILAVSAGLTVFVVLAERRSRTRIASDARRSDCMLARWFIEQAPSPEARAEILDEILKRRPGMTEWPEWPEVWDDETPPG